MKVEMLAHITGTRDGEEWPETGGVIELPKQEADELIRMGYARIPVGEAAKEAGNADQNDAATKDGDQAAAVDGGPEAADHGDEAAAETSRVDLTKATKAQLVEHAAALGLDTSGNKADLLERIQAAG